MRTRVVAGILAAALALLLFALQDRPGSSAPPFAPGQATAPAAPAAAEVASLSLRLDAERAARERLAAEVAELRAEVLRLRGEGPPPPLPEPVRPPDDDGGPARRGGSGPAEAAAAPTSAAFDAAALASAGFDTREIERLRERVEASELERLYLRDRAVREGWIGTSRFAEEVRALDARGEALRQELGDDRYDWILFASGRANRVVVESVLERSPAADAELRAGDAILAYDGVRLFDAVALRDATSAGLAGESVSVEVERDGERIRVTLPRGPLGVRLAERRAKPPPP